MWTVWTGKKKCVHCVYTKNEERNYNIESDIACILPDFISMDAGISDIFFFFYYNSHRFLHLLTFICFVLVISVRTTNISQSGSIVGGVRAFRHQNRYVNGEHKRMLLFFVSVYFFHLYISLSLSLVLFCLYIIWMNSEHVNSKQCIFYIILMHIEYSIPSFEK